MACRITPTKRVYATSVVTCGPPPSPSHRFSTRTPFCWRGRKNRLEQSDILTLLGIVMALAFAAQTVKQGRRVVPQLIGLALVIVAFGGYVAHRHREQTRKAQEEAAKRAEFESRISAYAAKHNAVAEWQKPVPRQNYGRPQNQQLTTIFPDR